MKETAPQETPEEYEARRNQEEAARKAAELGKFLYNENFINEFYYFKFIFQTGKLL